MSPEGSERILSKTVAWGTARDDLRAIAVVGSRARADHPADPWSDLDPIVMARRPKRYLTGSHWLAEIETPWVSSVAFSLAGRALETLRRRPFLLTLLPRIARDRLNNLSDLLNRGFRFVLDKDRIADRLESGGLPAPPLSPPSQEEYLDLVRSFLNEQVSIALKLRRGEFFVAKTLGEARLISCCR